jgi:hypothetical protein
VSLDSLSGRVAMASLAAVLTSFPASAGQLPIVNARVETRSAAQGLAREIQAVRDRGTAAWVGYRIAMVQRPRVQLSSTGSCCGTCRLEPATELLVLARVERKEIVELRAQGVDCDLDAGGMPVVWLDGVVADESVAWLASLVRDSASGAGRLDPTVRPALMALALHATSTGVPALIGFARDVGSADLRGQALFWLSQRASDQAAATIADAIDRDPEIEVKKKAVFALSQLPKDEGVPRLIDVAKGHRSAEVRRQAMFWLGQSRDPRALEFFTQLLLK